MHPATAAPDAMTEPSNPLQHHHNIEHPRAPDPSESSTNSATEPVPRRQSEPLTVSNLQSTTMGEARSNTGSDDDEVDENDSTSSDLFSDDDSIEAATCSMINLLDLPAEVRLNIYNHLVSGVLGVQYHVSSDDRDGVVDLSIVEGDMAVEDLPILQVCKTIRSEALSVAWEHFNLKLCCRWDNLASCLGQLPGLLRLNVRNLEFEEERARQFMLHGLANVFPSLKRVRIEVSNSTTRPETAQETWSTFLLDHCRAEFDTKFPDLLTHHQMTYPDMYAIARSQQDPLRGFQIIYTYRLYPQDKNTHQEGTGWLADDFEIVRHPPPLNARLAQY